MATTDNEHLVQSEDPDHPANLIPRLCRQFYTLGKTLVGTYASKLAKLTPNPRLGHRDGRWYEYSKG